MGVQHPRELELEVLGGGVVDHSPPDDKRLVFQSEYEKDPVFFGDFQPESGRSSLRFVLRLVADLADLERFPVELLEKRIDVFESDLARLEALAQFDERLQDLREDRFV